jgi:anti-sigma factor RsiW
MTASEYQADLDWEDLDWLAARFVLGELPAAAEEAVLARLPADESLATAVARASRLVATVRTAGRAAAPAGSEPALRSTPGPWRGRWPQLAALAAALAWIAWAIAPSRPGWSQASPDSSEVVQRWRGTDETVWPSDEVADDEEPATEADTVPDWMLAAVGLAPAVSDELDVLEN